MQTRGLFSALARARAGYNQGVAAGQRDQDAQDLEEASHLAQLYAQQRAAAKDAAELGLSRDRLSLDRENAEQGRIAAGMERGLRRDEALAAREAAERERGAQRDFMAQQNEANRQNALTIAGMRVDAAQAPKPAKMTASVVQHMAENRASLQKIDDAIAAAQANPNAFGLKNYLGDAIMQRAQPGGVGPRAVVADVGSLVFHDRSGAAVTPSEAERLKPFIPGAKDDPAAVVTKLKLLRQRAAMIAADYEDYYGQGPGVGTPAPAPAAPPPNVPRAPRPAARAAAGGALDLSTLGLEPPPTRRGRP